MIDISFRNGEVQGGSIQILSDSYSTTIVDFPGDDEPFTVEDIECIGHKFTLNNELFCWHKPIAYIARVSVVAGSANDETLSRMLEDNKWREQNGKDLSSLGTWMIVSVPDVSTASTRGTATFGSSLKSYTFEDGLIKSGSTAVSIDPEGKMKTKRYTFVFSKMTRN